MRVRRRPRGGKRLQTGRTVSYKVERRLPIVSQLWKGASEPGSSKVRETGVLLNKGWPAWCEGDVVRRQRERSEHKKKPESPALAGRSGWYYIRSALVLFLLTRE
ncbi:hypothetical protein Y032_0122g1046 [Ancylostoma ceylanicum]|uniref:Uncharacterized protein n=1 Tax=Ancylostoma ceylanicum TaxID=53326 RepID=A0A016T9T2_9BILA|nr:hypothetical protein Y032_0122g1046 [Ancylostoma ceylanicum]